jgi:hypothetical protein
MSWEVFGTPPDPEPVCCPNCGGTHHTPGCEVCDLDIKRITLEAAVEKMRSALRWIYGATTSTPGLTDVQLGSVLAQIGKCAEQALQPNTGNEGR